jgi:molybdate transport system substrate-binding protein
MRELADKGEVGALGCTQITEILYTSGVRLAGPLPDAFELSTVYSAGIPVTSEHPEAARHVIETITGPTTEEARRAGGFDPCA